MKIRILATDWLAKVTKGGGVKDTFVAEPEFSHSNNSKIDKASGIPKNCQLFLIFGVIPKRDRVDCLIAARTSE